MKKCINFLKFHKKISVAILVVLVLCLAGGIWLVQTRSRNKAALTEQASAEKGELSLDSDSKEKSEKADSSEDSKDEKAKNSGEETEQEAAEAMESTPASTDSSTTSGETSKKSVKASSNSSAKTSSGQKESTQKSTTSKSSSSSSAKASKSSSAPTQNTNSSSHAVKPTQPKQNTQTAQPTQPAQPAKPSGHYETRQVLVSAAYDEPVYETQVVGVKCNTCGQVFSTFEAWEAHSDSMIDQGDTNHMSYSGVYGQVQTGTKHHDAIYKTEQVWVQD